MNECCRRTLSIFEYCSFVASLKKSTLVRPLFEQMKKKFECLKAWGEAFFEILDVRTAKPSENYEHDEKLIYNAIRGFASIVSLKCVSNNEVPLAFFRSGDIPIVRAVNLLTNIYELPVAFSLPARCLALKTLGSMIRGLSHDQLHDPIVNKVVMKSASSWKARLVEPDSPQLCAQAWALGRLAVVPETKRTLARFVEQFVKDFDSAPAHVQIAICKVVQYMDQVNETLVTKLHDLSKSHRVGRAVSAYASLAWLTTNLKRRSQNLKLSTLVAHFVKVLEEESDATVIKACLKVLYVIMLKDPDSREQCVKALHKYLMEGNPKLRDRVFVLLAKYSVRYDDEQLQKKLLSVAVAHVEDRIASDTLLPNVVTGMCLIGMNNPKYAKQVYDLIERMLSQRCMFPGIVFKCYIGYQQDWDDGMCVEPDAADLFADVEVPKIGGESVEMTYEWKTMRKFVPTLYNVNILELFCGLMAPGRVDVPTCAVYEDVVAHFLIAVTHPKLLKTAVPSLFHRLNDKQKQDRRRCVWEDVGPMLGSYCTVNHCQLLYALIVSQKLCSEGFLRWLIREIDDGFRSQENQRKPPVHSKRKQFSRPPVQHHRR